MDFDHEHKHSPEVPARVIVGQSQRHIANDTFDQMNLHIRPYILLLAAWVTIFSYSSNSAAVQPSIKAEQTRPVLTNVFQLHRLAANDELLSCPVRLEGTVVWVSQARDQFILQDESGVMALKLHMSNYPSLKPGQIVRLRADCIIGRGLAVCTALVDNDGTHALRESSGRLFLPKGRWPICVEWFNDLGTFGLSVEWMGPNMSRRPITDDCLFRTEMNSTNGSSRFVQGLDYRCFEGKWDRLPDFSSLPAKNQGVINNFDLDVRTRTTEVGLLFSGYLEAPKDGVYTFWTTSDDGSKLFIGDPAIRLDILGVTNLPTRQTVQLALSHADFEENTFKFAEVEGTVTFFREFARNEIS